MTDTRNTTDQLTINTIRTLSMDMIQKANSGHPGAPMGIAPAAYTLFKYFLKHNTRNFYQYLFLEKNYQHDNFVIIFH